MRTTTNPPHPIRSGGKENQLRMSKHIRIATMLLVVVAFAVLAAGCGSKKKSATTTTTSSGGTASVVGSGTFDDGDAARGGNYRIGWEQSFGFTGCPRAIDVWRYCTRPTAWSASLGGATTEPPFQGTVPADGVRESNIKNRLRNLNTLSGRHVSPSKRKQTQANTGNKSTQFFEQH